MWQDPQLGARDVMPHALWTWGCARGDVEAETPVAGHMQSVQIEYSNSILRLWIPVNCKDYTLVWILNTLNTVIFLWNVYWRQRVFCQDECARRSLRLLDHITDEAFDTQAADCLWKKMRGVRVECKKNVRKKRSSNFWTWKNTRSLTTQEKVSCCIAENGAYLSSNVALFRCLWRFQV